MKSSVSASEVSIVCVALAAGGLAPDTIFMSPGLLREDAPADRTPLPPAAVAMRPDA